MDEEPAAFRSGFATLVGRPNVGKSTLVNALVGRKVAIVTPHPQTTRTHLLGVVNAPQTPRHPAGQVVLVDTPGVHRGRGHLSREMMRSVRAGLEGRDLSLFLCDVTRGFGAEDNAALRLLEAPPAPAAGEADPEADPEAGAEAAAPRMPPTFLLLNKVDLLADKNALLPMIEAYRQRFAFAEVVPLSALRGENVAALLEKILAYLPPGPEYFAPATATDQPEHFLISEVIREKAMLLTHEEVPHTLAVRIESDQTKRQNLGPLRLLQAALYCERPGQKAILIGQGGEMIRRIGTQARQELEGQLGTRVFLELHVLVRESWRDNPRFVAELDFRRQPK